MNNVYDVALAPSTSTARGSASAGSAAATTYTGALHQQPEPIRFLHRGGPGQEFPAVGPLPQEQWQRGGHQVVMPEPRQVTPPPPVRRGGAAAYRMGSPLPAATGAPSAAIRSRSPPILSPGSPRPAAPQRGRRLFDLAGNGINVGAQAEGGAAVAAGDVVAPRLPWSDNINPAPKHQAQARFVAYHDPDDTEQARSPSPQIPLRNFENAQRQAGSPLRQVTPPPRERRDLAVPDAPRRIRGRAGQRRVGNFGPDIVRELQPEFEVAAERMRHDDDGAGALLLQGPQEVVRRAGLFDDSDGSDQENRPPR